MGAAIQRVILISNIILVRYVDNNVDNGFDWNTRKGLGNLENADTHNLKYEFDIKFHIPMIYSTSASEIAVIELDGKTEKMYKGGKICLTGHFKPLWARN